jgi:GNAT superfamily N-acetyltransferase
VTSQQVIPAGPEDAGTLAQVIADAFFDLPQSRWLISDPGQRRVVFPAYFRIFVDHALAAGLVHTTQGRTGVALWLPVSADGPVPPGTGYNVRLAQITGPWAARFQVLDTELGRRHPAGTAHHHLAMLAVRPDAQGQGIGAAMLRSQHATLDEEGTPAYLEASTPRTWKHPPRVPAPCTSGTATSRPGHRSACPAMGQHFGPCGGPLPASERQAPHGRPGNRPSRPSGRACQRALPADPVALGRRGNVP